MYLCVWFLRGTYKNILFDDFTKAFKSIHRGKMDQILLTCGLPKETIADIMLYRNTKIATMILYRNTKVKVRSTDGHTDYFNIIADVLQGVTLSPYLFISWLDYVLGTPIDKMKENSFKLNKEKKLKVPRTNNYRRGLCASGKYTCTSRNQAT